MSLEKMLLLSYLGDTKSTWRTQDLPSDFHLSSLTLTESPARKAAWSAPLSYLFRRINWEREEEEVNSLNELVNHRPSNNLILSLTHTATLPDTADAHISHLPAAV